MKQVQLFLLAYLLYAGYCFSMERVPLRHEFILDSEESEELKIREAKRQQKHEKVIKFINNIIDSNFNEVEKTLIEGINLNKIPYPIDCPLIYAVANLSESMINLLLRYKANPNIVSYVSKNTPLSYLVKELSDKYQSNPMEESDKLSHLSAIKILLYHGANPYKKAEYTESAFDIAVENKNELLITLFSSAQKNLINTLHKLLSRGQTPFPSDVALTIAKFRYEYK